MSRAIDLVICGGGVGGCAAALAACRAGLRVVLTEESPWIGGQLTSQAVPPDEHGWIERFGCTASYRRFRDGIRRYYRDHYPLTDAARAHSALNPGNGWVSPLCHEPRVALAVVEAMLAPHAASGRLSILRRHRPVAANAAGNRVRSVTVRSLETAKETTLDAPWFIDATELGDLLPLTGTEFVTGSEARSETGEPSAGATARPANTQAFSVCFVMEHRAGENHLIPRPERYSFWRDYVPRLTPAWPGRLLSWEVPHPRTMEKLRYRFDPTGEDGKAFSGLWTYRRIVDRANFTPGFFPGDVCLVNWPLIDYLEGDLCTADMAERTRLIAEARQMSLCVFHWLQTEAPRPDGGAGWPGLRLRPDLLGSTDGLAQAPYIRESRRIRALYTVTETDVSAEHRPGQTLGERYPDSAGIGYYRIDLHPSVGGDNYIDVPALPFEIPLRALVPRRMENLLAGAKNLGVTHITNGCYRLHPVEWNIGEAAGALTAWCHERKTLPAEAAQRPKAFQDTLRKTGFELHWPDGLRLEDGDPHIHAR
ncbi:MAG: FAD-dependent oxidoreductase [Bryobacterales bacterium]|nr:FAD-dependent oxidoreductase [Bryobacterales bacterium]